MANTTDAKLFESLERKHPDYIEWSDEWEKYRDMLGDVLIDKKRYLPRNKIEPTDQYDFRIDVSEFIPESGLAVEQLIGALYDKKPKREFSSQQREVAEFLDNADRRGNSWNSVIEDIAFQLIGYGTTRVLINTPSVEKSVGPVTRLDEKSLGIRPYVINYGPLAITDWDTDDLGQLIFVRIREERFKKLTDNRLEESKNHVRFIEYDQESVRWWVFVLGESGGYELIDDGQSEHGLGMVPMVVAELREVKSMIGHSFIRYSSGADKQKFQNESDQAYDTYLHAHPFLKIWTEDNLKDVGIGTNAYLKLRPGGSSSAREDADYVKTPDSAFEALRQVINDKRVQIYRQAKTDPLGVINSDSSSFQASGVARAWSFGTSEARILSKLASKMKQIEDQIFEIVIRMQSGDRTFTSDQKVSKADIQYPEEFDMSATDTLIDQRSEIAQQVNSPTLLRVLDKRIAASKVGDASAKTLRDIQNEIDSNPLIGTSVGGPQDGVFSMPGQELQQKVEKTDTEDKSIQTSRQQKNRRQSRVASI